MIVEGQYRTVEVNRQLVRVYFGSELVGQVRQGLDQLWYAEQPGERHKAAAVHRAMIAHQAIEEFTDAVNR